MPVQYPNGHDPLGDTPEPEHDPDPKWALEDMGEDEEDDLGGGAQIPSWVIILAVLIALALLLQLGWPLVMDFLERNQDSPGFPTPGPV
ncbi:MAG TPA: hypothetical protein VGR22_10285 [Thermomicrobiales bacterium]|nr:hypothetical protein [Thermomicrobiales bacterium]